MKNALLVAGRELGAYTRSPIGYIVIAAGLLIGGILFYIFALGAGAQESARVLYTFFWGGAGVIMIVSVPLSMRLFAGEREAGTLVLLNTAPIRDVEIVAGKFLSALAVVTVMMILSVYMPALIFVNGKVSVGHILVGYLGLFLIGAASLSIGMFASALSRNQIIAVIVGALLVGLMVVMWWLGKGVDPPLNTFFAAMALHNQRQQPFDSGVIKLENVAYYVAITYFFLLATTKTLEARRWR